MILKQRRRHKYVWLAIAIVLPVAMFFAVKNVSFHQMEQKIPQLADVSNATTHATNEQLEAALIKIADGYTLEVRLKQPLVSSSSLVYALDVSGNKSVLLGQLNGTGDYSFASGQRIGGIAVYDTIKENEILKLMF